MKGWQFSRTQTFARETVAHVLGPPLSWLIRGPQVTGAEHLVQLDGPFVVSANHASHLDTSTLRLALGPHYRRRLAIAAAADYFWRYHTLSFLAGWLGGFPFNRHGLGGADSMREIEQLLAEGWGVLIFPEGTRSRTGEMGQFKPGVGLVAIQTGCQVLPVRIRGTWDVWPPGQWVPHRRGRVTVAFGSPMRAEAAEDARKFTARLEAAVRNL